jgi:DNA-binding NtrC family response regulator
MNQYSGGDMASVLIIDDSKATSALLKLSLMHRRHRVRRSQDITEAVHPRGGAVPDLVLINRGVKMNTGWEIFNCLKQLAPNLPTMVYVLEDNCVSSANWICKAVEAAFEEIDSPPRPPCALPVQLPPA